MWTFVKHVSTFVAVLCIAAGMVAGIISVWFGPEMQILMEKVGITLGIVGGPAVLTSIITWICEDC